MADTEVRDVADRLSEALRQIGREREIIGYDYVLSVWADPIMYSVHRDANGKVAAIMSIPLALILIQEAGSTLWQS